MNRKLIASLILVGLALPGVAQAKVTRAELRRDVHEVKQERRDVRHELHQRDLHGVKQERRELRDAKHDLRHDKRAFRRQHQNHR